jgi:hypothetical protein
VNRSCFLFFAACRTPRNPWDTPASLCVESVCDREVLLGPLSSLPNLRRRPRFPWLGFVRLVHRYYKAVRLLGIVHAGRSASAFSRRTVPLLAASRCRGLPVLVHAFLSVLGVYDYAGPANCSPLRCWPCCLPLLSTGSAPRISFTKLNTRPTDTFVYASFVASRRPTQDSRPRWFATPFL